MVSFLLGAGVLWPMLLALGVESSLPVATAILVAVLLLLVMQGVSRRARIVGGALTVLLAGAQFFLPRAGFFRGLLRGRQGHFPLF